MTPEGTPDPEYPTSSSRKGDRLDKRNLINVWLKAKPVGLSNIFPMFFFLFFLSIYHFSFVFQKKKSHYVWNKKGFDEINVKTTDRLMGECQALWKTAWKLF